MRRIAAVLTAFLLAPSASADDGAASIAVGGIVMKHEPRITMAKDILKISSVKVVVDYDFRNDTAQDISTTVAFPIPAYELDPNSHSPSQQGFDDFRLFIEGKPVHFETAVKAFLKDRDVSSALTNLHIDIASFGHFSEDNQRAADIRRLTPAQRTSLAKMGLIDTGNDQDEGLWRVKKNYYWQQTFPAHSTIHISHEYTPVLGATNSVSYGLNPKAADKDAVKELNSVCPDPGMRRSLSALVAHPENSVPLSYVDFILTTANTWKTPIEDFTLIVERPHLKDAQQNLVTFCWDGPIKKVDADHFEAHLANLVPKIELRIGFITVYGKRP